MRKLMFAVAALAALAAAVPPAEAAMAETPIHGIVINHPGCIGAYANNQCIHGIILHRVCVKWEIFGGRRRCVQWRIERF